MSLNMIKHLILKDFSQGKPFILMYTVFGIISVCISLLGGETWFYMSMVLVITCLIGVGMHPMFAHILVEKKENNFPFVMSLPVSHMEYTIAKIMASYLFAAIPWICIVVAVTVVTLNSPLIFDGFLGPALVVAFEMFAAYSLGMGVAIVLNSEAAIVVAIVTSNIFVNFFLMWLFRLEEVASISRLPEFTWNSTLTTIVGLELLFMVVAITLICFLQSRKKDLI